MTEITNNTIVEAIFSYKDKNGTKYWTPNSDLAEARAKEFKTNDVWVETYEVILTETK